MNPCMDSGLQSLALIARLHHIAVDPAQLQHQFGQHDQTCSIDDLLRASASLGFRSSRTKIVLSQLNAQNLPAICTTKDGEFFVLARVSEGTEGVSSYLIQNPQANAPETLTYDQLTALWSGKLVLLVPKWRHCCITKTLGL
jgi:subfamily B ATP-binding cassette protein HlyB/CyaB